MQLIFNKSRMNLQVLCGVLEKYKPNKEIKKIYKKINKLHEQMTDFQQQVMLPALTEIDELIEEENKKYVEEKEESNSEEV